MDDRDVNIDIVFRNGLKDLEVLPPQDVWNDIQPAVRKKQRPIVLLRAAAMFGVLFSLSLLAYKFSREIPAGLESPSIAMSPESYAAVSEVIVATLPAPDITENQTSLQNTSPDETRLLTPVATDNIASGAQEFETNIITNSLTIKRDEPPAAALALNYNYPDYSSFGESNRLEEPENTTRKLPGRWSISALISPTYQSGFTSGDNEAVIQAMASEQAVLSYSGGLALSYKINKRFSVQSGLYYSSIGKELTGISAYSGFSDHFYTKGRSNFVITTSTGTVYSSNNDIFLSDRSSSERIQTSYNNNVIDPVKSSLTYLDNSIYQNFRYLELPIILRYKFIDKTLDLNIIGGVSSNLLVNNSVYAFSDGGKTDIGVTDGLNMITFSSSLGMGMEYNLSGNLSVNLEPMFRYYINPFNNIPGMKIHPYSFGVFSGISYKF